MVSKLSASPSPQRGSGIKVEHIIIGLIVIVVVAGAIYVIKKKQEESQGKSIY
jgi:hypothetical protein